MRCTLPLRGALIPNTASRVRLLSVWANLNIELRQALYREKKFEADNFASRRPSVMPLCLVTWYVHQRLEYYTIH